MFWHLERLQFRILFKVEKVFGTVSVDTTLITFLLNLDKFVAIDSFLSELRLESYKDLF